MTAARKTRHDNDYDHDNDDVKPAGKGKAGKAYDMAYSGKLAFLSAVNVNPKVTSAAKSAAAILLDFHNQTLGFSWPSLDTLAERMQVSRSTAKAAVAQLIELGFFRKETVFREGCQGSNRMFPIMVPTTAKGRWAGFEAMDRGRNSDRGGPIPRPRGGRNSDRAGAEILTPGGGDSSPPSKVEGNPVDMNLIQNEKNHFGAAAALHEGELFLCDEMLADGEPVTEEMQDRPEEMVETSMQPQAQAMKEGSGRTERQATIPVPHDIQPSQETLDRLLGLGIPRTQIDASVQKWVEHFAGKKPETPERWAERLDRWLAGEQLRPAQHADLKGVPFPEDYRPARWINDRIQSFKMTESMIHMVYERFVQRSRAATGYKALSRDWDANFMEFLLQEEARFQQQKSRSGPAI